MTFLSKKKIILFCTVLVILVASVAGGIIYAVSPGDYIGTVVLDAGHGGWDNGVSGANSGVRESDLNLTMVYMLEAELKSRKYNVVFTRKDGNALGDTKQEDMKARQDIIDKARPDMVLSIHMNKFSDTKRRGAQVFYDDTGKGEAVAKLMQGTLNTHLNAKYAGRDNLEAQAGDYYMTKCYPCPSMIVECGFLSNAEDEKLLTSNSYQKQLAKVICDGVEAIFSASAFLYN